MHPYRRRHLTFAPVFAVISAMRPLTLDRFPWPTLAAVASAVLLAGCGPKSSTSPTVSTPSAPSEPVPFAEPPAVTTDITTGKHGGRLVIATISDAKTLNPTTANESSSTEIFRLLYAKLARFNWETQEAEPDLAHEWSVAEDQRTWTYKLRKNLFWSDGHPLTADDVIFTWNDVIYNPDIVNVTRDAFTIDGREFKVTKIDEHTFQVVTPTVFAPFVEFFGDVEILPKHVLATAVTEGRFASAYGINTPPSELVVSGPFRLKQFKPGEFTLLERNPFYHRTDETGRRLPYLDNIVFTVTPDMNAMSLRFLSGESDVHEIVRASEYNRFREQADAGKFRLFDLGVGPEKAFIFFNQNSNQVARLKVTSNPPDVEINWNETGLGKTPIERPLTVGRVRLVAVHDGVRHTNTLDLTPAMKLPLAVKFDFGTVQLADPAGATTPQVKPIVPEHKLKLYRNQKFRQAISYALDRPSIIKSVYGGRAEFNYGYISPANQRWYNPDVARYAFDLVKAKALLKEIGVEDRDGDGKLEDSTGNPVEFTLNTNTGNTDREKIAVIIQEDLKRLGIALNFQPVDFNALVDKINVSHDFDCILLGLGGGFLDPQASRNVLASDGFTHFWFPRQTTPSTPWEARIDELLQIQVQELDFTKRKLLIDEVQAILSEQLPFIYTVQKLNYAAIRNGVGNVKPTGMWTFRVTWNAEELYLE